MNIITIGKRLIPIEQIAFVELFEPSSNPNFKPERDYKGRVVLLNRDPVLTEQTPNAFATENQFEFLAEDEIALNRIVAFKVETFEPREGFMPAKPFKTRLKWRDPSGLDQSKLLLTEPLTVAALLVNAAKGSTRELRSARPRGRRRLPREPVPAK